MARVVILKARKYDEACAALEHVKFYLDDLQRTGFLRKGTVPEADLNSSLVYLKVARSALKEGNND